MVDKQVTTMVLKVDLQCKKCYRKIKQVLCKISQIQDQIYNEKENTVTIKVVCCSPEKIKNKIICKAKSALKSIEIKVPEENPKPPDPKPEPDPTPPPKPEDKDEKTKKPPSPEPSHRNCCHNCSEGRGGGPCHHGGYWSDYPYNNYCGGYYNYGYGYGRPACSEVVVVCPQDNYGPPCSIM